MSHLTAWFDRRIIDVLFSEANQKWAREALWTPFSDLPRMGGRRDRGGPEHRVGAEPHRSRLEGFEIPARSSALARFLIESSDMKTIDLRSDTVTRPTEAMRRAMASAEVGDDVYGEDPTVNRLQEVAAELTGKEAALFVASGTMGNQATIAAATRPGDAVLVGEDAHLLLYESGAGAALFGVQVETVGSGGFFRARKSPMPSTRSTSTTRPPACSRSRTRTTRAGAGCFHSSN